MSYSKETLSPDEFSVLTLEAQIEHLTAVLSHEPAELLVQLCAEVRDPAPLSWLCRRLLERNWLQDEKNRAWLASFLIKQAETTVHKVLRSITEPPLREADRPLLATLMIDMLKVAEMKELSSICLVDRALRRNFSEEHDAYLAELLAQSTSALRGGATDRITPAQMAQLPASDIPALYAAAAVSGGDTTRALDELRQRLSIEAIEVLGDAPKAVSQANAEDLLARRVYTDPGHFLIELLQNAEDSGARHWRVLFDSTKIVVWHDGAPFDARDLVGVTSIGQTTKRKQQIGFFGVGFKSVYEVTDRPQIYSDVWKFEIADVSIPKVLAKRPDNVQAEGTVLVLPLRANLDYERSPKSLYEKATQLDACVLLTLRSIDVIELELTAAAGGPARHALVECVRQERSSIRHEPSGKIRTYLIRDDRYEYDAKAREAGRASETMVMVGVLFDEEHHKPVQLEDSAATVYSYLPTREKTGLRFFVQGHFDVPLDRERIAPDSEWNQWILSQVPHQLAQLARKISDDCDLTGAQGLLDVLPLKSELAPSLFQIIVDGLKPALQAIAFVPAVDASLRAPQDILVAPPQIAALFQGKPVSENRFLLNSSLNTRAQELVLAIGAAPFDTPHLLTYLEALLSSIDEGAPPSTPAFLSDISLLENLYDILLAEADRLDREDAPAELKSWLERLKKLPIVMKSDGQLAPPQRLARGSATLRAIYGGIFEFVHERLEDSSARTLAFLDRTGVLAIDIEYMMAHMERELESVNLPLSSPQAVSFPGSEERLSLILHVLTAAGWEHQKRASRLPLFRAIDGAFWPAAQSASDGKGVLRVRGHVGAELAKFYGKRRPLADVNDVSAAAALLLDRVDTPLLDLSTLCEDLGDNLFGRDLPTLRQLHALLESVEDELSDKTAKQLCKLPIWPDRNGDGRPLRGSHAVLIPENEEICQLFIQAPFLDEEICRRKHIKRLGVDLIGAAAVVHALTIDATAPLVIEHNAPRVEAALAYLLRYAGNLDAEIRGELKGAHAFLSDDKQIHRLGQLCIAVSPQLRSLYGSSRERHFVDPDGTTFKLIRALAFDGALVTADAACLIDDLEKPRKASLIHDRQSLRQILAYLASEAESIPGSALARLVRLAIFPDQKGVFGALLLRNAKHAANTVRPCEASVRPLLTETSLRLLDADIESVVKPILDQVHAPYAGLEELIEFLRTSPMLPHNVLEPLQKLLVERKNELVKIYPVENEPGRTMASLVINGLTIWKSQTGHIIDAAEVVVPGASEILLDCSAEIALLNQRTLDDDSFQRLQALAPLVAPMPCEQFICDLVARLAIDKAPLEDQPRFLSTVDRVNKINSLIATQPNAAPVYVDGLNQLRLQPLHFADPPTYALLENLPVMADLLHPAFQQVIVQKAKSSSQPSFSKQVKSIAGFFKRFTGDVNSEPPSLVSSMTVDCEPFPPSRVIVALGRELEEKRRPLFYAWLATNEDDIYKDGEACKLLAEAPFFRTRSGAMVCARDLVIETDLPDIGIDWFPSQEIPEAVLTSLQKHLNVGRPKLNDLIKRNVVPAYIDACQKSDKEKAGRLLHWLAQRLSDRSPAQIKDLVLPKDGDKQLLFEDAKGDFRSLDELVIPAQRITECLQAIWGTDLLTPSPSRYSPFVLAFLADLGIPSTPALASIRAKLQSPQSKEVSAGLAGLISYLRNQNGESIYGQLPLHDSAWLQDGAGEIRRTCEIFVRSAEVERIVGPFAELYLADGLYEILGDTLARELKFREISSITFEDVARHIVKCTESRKPPPFAVYVWLDEQVRKKRLDAAGLNRLFGASAWIWTDDAEVYPHAHVLGVRAFHLFKSRRGYWERGFKECRALCEALNIPSAATPSVVADFVEELGKEVKVKGSRKVLLEDPALPHMLLAAFDILGNANRAVDRSLPVVPCTDSKDEIDLLAASAKNLFWSDTPTLDVLFSKAGPLCLAMRGRADEREGVEKFHESMGVRRLRDAYRLVADGQSGSDRSERMCAQIGELRSTLRALAAVLPRVELERPLSAPSAWVYGKRLHALTEGGVIKAVDNLGVLYVLPGVCETRVQQMATYEIDNGTLTVDTRVLNDSERTGLAEGLIAAIVEGPMADSFIDLVEILLARVTKERMNEYLNRRHFADAAAPLAANELIADRIIEILDYGLELRLKRSFPALSESALEMWRDPNLIRKIENACGNADVKNAAPKVVPLLLEALALKNVPEGLDVALEKMLCAQTLSDASSVLVESARADSLVVRATEVLQEPNTRVGVSQVPHEKSELRSPDNLLIQLRKNPMLLAGGASLLVVFVGTLLVFLQSLPTSGGTAAGVAVSPSLIAAIVIFFALLIAVIVAVFAFSTMHLDIKAMRAKLDVLLAESWSRVKTAWSQAIGSFHSGNSLLEDSHSGESKTARSKTAESKEGDSSFDQTSTSGKAKPSQRRTTNDARHSKTESSVPSRDERPLLPIWTEGNGFKPHQNIGPQLWATRANCKIVAAREVTAQLSFSPSYLPSPYLYAVQSLGISFSYAEQTWTANEQQKSELNTPGFPSGRFVQFSGLMHPGRNHMPLPLYGRIVGEIETDGGPVQSFVQDAVTATCVIPGTHKVEVRYRVQLLETPKLEGKLAADFSVDKALLEPTVAFGELPDEVQEWIDKTRSKKGSQVMRALAAQAFIRRNYAYDDGFLERQEVRRARARLVAGQGNHHLKLLHASSEGSILGRGVCYELNVLLVELLRRLDVPAMTATGWVLAEGKVDLPDHLFALAVVPSEQGACLLTLDAAATDQGPIRALAPHKKPPAEAEMRQRDVMPLPPVPAPRGAWNNAPAARNERFLPGGLSPQSKTSNARKGASSAHSSSDDEHDFAPPSVDRTATQGKGISRHTQTEIALLKDAIYRVCTVTGADQSSKIADDLPSLAAELSRLLGDRTLAETYLLILRGDLHRLDVVSPSVQHLVNLGLAHVEPLSAYKVGPVDPDLSNPAPA